MPAPRTLDDWNPLPAERKLAVEKAKGQIVVIGDGTVPPETLPETDPRVIRTNFLRALILGRIEDHPPHEKGVRVAGAYLRGDRLRQSSGLDLEGCDLTSDLGLYLCYIPDRIKLRTARLRNLFLQGSYLDGGISAEHLEAKGDVLLRGLPDPSAQHAHPFVAQGEVLLSWAKIGGSLDCTGALLKAENAGSALSAEGLEARGDVVLNEVKAQGSLMLSGSKVGGDLQCRGAVLTAGQQGLAFSAERLEAKGGAFLRGLQAQGEVRFLGARLGGDLDCQGAFLTAGQGRQALSADGLQVAGAVFLSGLGDPGSPKFRPFVAYGEVRLRGAKVGQDLSCTAAWLTAGNGDHALLADRLEVMGSLFLRALRAQGTVRLVGAKLGGDLDCADAKLETNPGGKALNGDGIRIEGTFYLRGMTQIDGVLDLGGAEIGHIADVEGCWPKVHGHLALDQCRYGAFVGTGTPVQASERIRWLSLQEESRWGAEFWPQPWEECARVLREMGHGAAARDILIEKEKRQRAARRARLRREGRRAVANWHGVADAVLGVTVRYGRVPLLALAWLLLPLALGAVLFGVAHARDAIKPNLPQIQRAPEWVLCGVPDTETVMLAGQSQTTAGLRAPGQSRIDCFHARAEGASHPRFNALVYSADALIPVVSLEMQSYRIPDDTTPFGAVARGYLWLHIAAGWFLSLLAVAGFSGLIKTDKTK